jgi:hypothetical protein
MGRWLTNSRDLIARLKEDGWVLDRIESSHHQFKKPRDGSAPEEGLVCGARKVDL